MKKVIFDLDLTLVDTTCLEQARQSHLWQQVYNLIPKTKLYEGVLDVFNYIRRYNVSAAIVSTAPRKYIEKIVKYHDIPVKYIIGYNDAKPIKPHPNPMLKALHLLSCSSQEAISFGDRQIDIMSSNSAGIPSVACFWGSKEREKLAESKYSVVIYEPKQIISLIQ